MSETPLNLTILLGYTGEGRLGPRIATWFSSQLEGRADFRVDWLSLAEAQLPDQLSRERPATVQRVTSRLDWADAFVVITPEYNHSYPAPLKTLIDWHYEPWHGKPVGFVCYGGASGGLRAVEHLRHVFTEVHATTIRNTLSFHMAPQLFEDDASEPRDAATHELYAKKLLDQLAWWGQALREARLKRPYPL